jgi:hypothetical protein
MLVLAGVYTSPQPNIPRRPCDSREELPGIGFARQGLLMPDKTYLIRFNEADIVPLRVIAATVETYGDHLAFLRRQACSFDPR